MTVTTKRLKATACPPKPLDSEPSVQRWTDDQGREHVACPDTDTETVEKCRKAIAYWAHPKCPERYRYGAFLADANAEHWRTKLSAVEQRMAREAGR